MAEVAAILVFWSEQFYQVLINKLPWYFLPSFKPIGISVQEKKFKIDFQDGGLVNFESVSLLVQVVQEKFKIDFPDGGHSGHFRFPIRTIFAISDLQVALILPTKFQVNCLSVQEKKFKVDFQDGSHGGRLGFWIGTILAIFDLQVAPIFPSKFQITRLSVQEKKFKIDFQDGRRGGHLGFWIWTSLAIFYLQGTSMLPTKFQVSWPFGSGEEAKIRFSRWQTWWPS